MRINQNVMANNASRNLANTNVMLGKSLEKLSSGFRINRAADDAAGLVVSQGLRSQIGGLKQATRNAQDGISVVQTAEGALNEVHTMLGRMRDLAVQSANTGANDTASRTAAQAEITALASEITRTSTDTKFGGTTLLSGAYGSTPGTASAFNTTNSIVVGATGTINVAVTGGSGVVSVNLQAGTYTGAAFASVVQSSVQAKLASTGNAIDAAAGKLFTASASTVGSGTAVTFSNGYSATVAVTDGTGTPLVTGFGAANGLISTLAAATGAGGTFQIGADSGQTVGVAIGNMSAATLGVGALDVITSNVTAGAAITSIDAAITSVSTLRGNLGALQNRFESMINNLQVTGENLAASESRIRDTDMATEMVSFTKNNVLLQAGTAMLAQANQVPQSILSLLK
jgi:flagellin